MSNAAKFQLYTSACTWCHLSTGERLSHAHLNWNTRAPTCFTCNQNCDVSQMKCKEFQCLGLNLRGDLFSVRHFQVSLQWKHTVTPILRSSSGSPSLNGFNAKDSSSFTKPSATRHPPPTWPICSTATTRPVPSVPPTQTSSFNLTEPSSEPGVTEPSQ